jgi:hypothetical protein
MTSRAYIIAEIDEKRAALAADPRGVEFLNLVRSPIDLDTDEDGSRSEKGFNLIESLIAGNERSPDQPVVELAMHAAVIKGYAEESELQEVDSVAQVLELSQLLKSTGKSGVRTSFGGL